MTKEDNSPVKNLASTKINRIFLMILAASIIFGAGSGYYLASGNKTSSETAPVADKNSKSAQQDARTFRDFAEGTLQKRPAPKNADEYVEGTHILTRDGAMPVALTSSVVDLSQYEGKKVKVFGETQKALKEGWLMDVGKVETE